MYKNIKTLAKILLSAHVSRAYRGADQWRRFWPALPSTAALLQTGTSTLTLHRHFLSARYLSGLSFSGEHERNWAEWYWTERHTAQWWRLRERGNLNTARRCGTTYIFGGRKFSASLVNGQNDSSRHIICPDEFLYSSYSRNRFSQIYIYIYIYVWRAFFQNAINTKFKKNEFVMPFCCVLNLFTAPSMFHAKSLYFLV